MDADAALLEDAFEFPPYPLVVCRENRRSRTEQMEFVPADSELVLQVSIAAVEPKGTGRYLVRCANAAYKATSRERPVMVGESLALVMA